MMNDYDGLMETIGYAENSDGASQEQFNKTLDSLASKLNNLSNAWTNFTTGITDSTVIKGAVDALTALLNTVNDLVSLLSGGNSATSALTSVGLLTGAMGLGTGAMGSIARAYGIETKLPNLTTAFSKTGVGGIFDFFKGQKVWKDNNIQDMMSVTPTSIQEQVAAHTMSQSQGQVWNTILGSKYYKKQVAGELQRQQNISNKIQGYYSSADSNFLNSQGEELKNFLGNKQISSEMQEAMNLSGEEFVRKVFSDENLKGELEKKSKKGKFFNQRSTNAFLEQYLNAEGGEAQLSARLQQAAQGNQNFNSLVANKWAQYAAENGISSVDAADAYQNQGFLQSLIGDDDLKETIEGDEGLQSIFETLTNVTAAEEKAGEGATSFFSKLKNGLKGLAAGWSALDPMSKIQLFITALTVVYTIAMKIADLNQTSKERLEDYTESMQEWADIAQEIKTSQSEINTLQSYRDEAYTDDKGNTKTFSELQRGVSFTGQNLSLSTEEYDAYLSICEAIVDINPELAEGYYSNAEAIAAQSAALDELIEKQEKAIRTEARAKVNSDEYKEYYADAVGGYYEYKNQIDNNSELIGNLPELMYRANLNGIYKNSYSSMTGGTVVGYEGNSALIDPSYSWLNSGISEKIFGKSNINIPKLFQKLYDSGAITKQQYQDYGKYFLNYQYNSSEDFRDAADFLGGISYDNVSEEYKSENLETFVEQGPDALDSIAEEIDTVIDLTEEQTKDNEEQLKEYNEGIQNAAYTYATSRQDYYDLDDVAQSIFESLLYSDLFSIENLTNGDSTMSGDQLETNTETRVRELNNSLKALQEVGVTNAEDSGKVREANKAMGLDSEASPLEQIKYLNRVGKNLDSYTNEDIGQIYTNFAKSASAYDADTQRNTLLGMGYDTDTIDKFLGADGVMSQREWEYFLSGNTQIISGENRYGGTSWFDMNFDGGEAAMEEQKEVISNRMMEIEQEEKESQANNDENQKKMNQEQFEEWLKQQEELYEGNKGGSGGGKAGTAGRDANKFNILQSPYVKSYDTNQGYVDWDQLTDTGKIMEIYGGDTDDFLNLFTAGELAAMADPAVYEEQMSKCAEVGSKAFLQTYNDYMENNDNAWTEAGQQKAVEAGRTAAKQAIEASRNEIVSGIKGIAQTAQQIIDDAVERGLDEDAIKAYMSYLKTINEELAENRVLLAQVATNQMLYENAISNTLDEYETWISMIDSMNANTQAGQLILDQIRESFAGLLGQDIEDIPKDFNKIFKQAGYSMEDLITIMRSAAKGDPMGIKALKKSWRDFQRQVAKNKSGMFGTDEEIEKYEEAIDSAWDKYNDFIEGFENSDIGKSIAEMNVGESFNEDQAAKIKQFQQEALELYMAQQVAAGKTYDEVEAISFVQQRQAEEGIAADVDIGYKTVTSQATYAMNGDGVWASAGGTITGTNSYTVPIITSSGEGTKTNSVPPSTGGGGGGGGGGEPAKPSQDPFYNYIKSVEDYQKHLDSLQGLADVLTEPLDIFENTKDQEEYYQRLLGANQSYLNHVNSELERLQEQAKEKYSQYIEIGLDGSLRLTEEYWASTGEITEELDEWIEAYDDVLGRQEDLNSEIADLASELKDLWDGWREGFIDLTNDLADIYQEMDEKELEDREDMYEKMEEADQKYLESVRNNIEEERNARERANSFEDLSKKQSRLALLQRDTSGRYANEIESLQEEIDDAQQELADSNVDTVLDALERQMDEDATRHEELINAMQEQIDKNEENRVYIERAEWAIAQGEEAILEVIKSGTDYNQASNAERESMIEEQATNIAGSMSYLEKLESGITTSSEYLASMLKSDIEKQTEEVTWAIGNIPDSVEERIDNGLRPSKDPDSTGTHAFTAKMALVTQTEGKVTSESELSIPSQFKTGGLVDYTGPAWVDGTKKKPEAFLNANQTAMFAALAASLERAGMSGLFSSGDSDLGGNCEINIDIGSIGADYDINRAIQQVKQEIVNSSQFRNITMLSRKR